MCIFTGEIKSVGDTRIFARQDANRQAVVYDMYLSTEFATAMVLPIPVASLSNDEKIEFIDLSTYPDFFDDIENLFPQWMSASIEGGDSRGSDLIEVHEVGIYDASFVPTLNDFKRLDSRFRLNSDFFEQVPEYSNYGFIVFKLKPGESQVHPMAFWFPKSEDRNLFFPTKHMHDGVVHNSDHYDHTLYAQGSFTDNSNLEAISLKHNLEELSAIAKRSFGLVSKDEVICKKVVNGVNKNEDIWLQVK